MAHTHAVLLKTWRERANSGQAEARKVLAEMLTPSGELMLTLLLLDHLIPYIYCFVLYADDITHHSKGVACCVRADKHIGLKLWFKSRL